MLQKNGVYALIGICLFIAAQVSLSWHSKNISLDTGMPFLQSWLHEAEVKFESFSATYRNNPKTDVSAFKQHTCNVSLYVKDELQWWTEDHLAQAKIPSSQKLQLIGDLLVYSRVKEIGKDSVLSWQCPILQMHVSTEGTKWSTPAIQDYYFDLKFQAKNGRFHLKNKNGDTLFEYDTTRIYPVEKHPISGIVLSICAFLCLFIFAYKIADKLIELGINKLFITIVYFLFLMGLRALWHYIKLSEFIEIYLGEGLNRTNDEVQAGSFMDTPVNLVFLLAMLLFAFKNLQRFHFGHLILSSRLFLATINYFGTLVAMVMLSQVFRQIIVDSPISFNFYSLFEISALGLMSILALLMLLFLFFIVSHRMAFVIHNLKLNLNQRLLSMGISYLMILPFFAQLETGFPLYYLYLAATVLLLLFDLFVDFKNPGVIWVSIWLLIFSSLSSVLMYKYFLDKEQKEANTIAKKIFSKDDPILINKLASFHQLKEKVFNQSQDAIFECINNDPYLKHYYQLRNASSTNQTEDIAQNHFFDFLFTLTEGDDIQPFRFQFKTGQHHFNDDQILPFKGISQLNNYSFSVLYKDSKAKNMPNSSNQKVINERLERDNANALNSLIIYSDGAKVVLDPLSHKWNSPFTFFSFIFGLLTILMLIIGMINSRYSAFPSPLSDLQFKNQRLSGKIQNAFLFLILFTFICIGVGSILYYKNNETFERIKYEEASLLDIISQINSYCSEDEQLKENCWLTSVTKSSLPIALYKSNKEKNGLVYQRGSEAGQWPGGINLIRIKPSQESQVLESKKANSGIQKFIHLALDDQENYHLVKTLPSKGQRNASPYLGFISSLINYYVLLLLFAVALSLILKQTLIQPLSNLGERMKSIKLGRKNEPLIWQSNDELGLLIQQYNAMVDSLEKSAEMIAQNEREIAWREMAKQVAHEIKNPLTPMKLSIQHLESKISTLNEDEIAPFVKRVSQTLIEQIDNLNRIATEFSSFSKLPEPNNEKIILNDLVSSVHDLFRKREDIVFNLYVPINEIYIYADKSHILRILNNLIKNALQAIPEETKGQLDIKLFTRKGVAIVQVSDNGTGIPNDMKDKVFYPNFTTKSSGTGLGLAICKDMVESYGGRIYFKTEMNKGTDFFVELPLYGLESE
jgi:signal transduction histidine kinase